MRHSKSRGSACGSFAAFFVGCGEQRTPRGHTLCLALTMNKRANEKAKPRTQAAHPETQRQRPETGAPGSDSSKVRSRTKDVRSTHDKDGNSQQRAR